MPPGPVGEAQGDPDVAFRLFGDWQDPAPEAGAAVYALDARGRVLMQLRDDVDGLPAAGEWSPFGGGVEKGETLRQAAAREFAEEVGLDLPLTAFRPYARALSRRGIRPRLYTYLTLFEGAPDRIRLGEGAGFAFLTPRQLRQVPLAQGLAAATLHLAERLDAGLSPARIFQDG